MNKDILETKISTPIGRMSIKKYFKYCLLEVLVDEPPKRFLGDSDWWTQLGTGLAEANIVPGGLEPCCEDFQDCGGDMPCFYSHKCPGEDIDEALRLLIEKL